MLTSFDDYPIHQTSQPVAFTANSDANFYDRYFFNGYQRSGELYFAAAMGLYPNRHVADAAFSVVRNGEQVNVHASRRAPSDRADALQVGPIEVQVVEGLKVLRVLVDAPEHGLRADLLFRRRTVAVQEPPFMVRTGQRVMMDLTRLTQFGTWEGWIELDGSRIDVEPAVTWGSRDRSWGVRPVGERAPLGAPVSDPQYYWLWAPVNFEGFCTHFDVNEYSDGTRWHEEAVVVPLDGDRDAVRTPSPRYRIEWTPGTRRASKFELDLVDLDGASALLTLQPIYEFQMLGIGYGHPEWAHGVWKGELAVAGDRWALPVANPLAFEHLHVQALCRATLTGPGGRRDDGIGILEQYVVGPHAPTGLTGLIDGYSG